MGKISHKMKDIVIYQAKSGKIEFRGDFYRSMVWGTQQQIAELFGRDKSVISRHVKNIFKSGELTQEATVAIFATVQKEGERRVKREIEYYNLDMILSVGYRVDSKQATHFRVWATKILKQHLLDGYTISKKRLVQNYQKFSRAVEDVKKLLPETESSTIKTQDVLGLVQVFGNAWFSLHAYDNQTFPKGGVTKKRVQFTADELMQTLRKLKSELIAKKEATELFGTEKSRDSLQSIVGIPIANDFLYVSTPTSA